MRSHELYSTSDHPYQSYLSQGKKDFSLITSIYNYLSTFFEYQSTNNNTKNHCAFCLMNSKTQELLTCQYVDGEGSEYNLCESCSQKTIDRRIKEMEKLV